MYKMGILLSKQAIIILFLYLVISQRIEFGIFKQWNYWERNTMEKVK